MAIVVAVGLCLIRGMNDEIISSGKIFCKGLLTLIESENENNVVFIQCEQNLES